MLKIISKQELTREDFFSTEPQARLHVTPNEPWIAFEVDKTNIETYLEYILEVSYNGLAQNVRAYGYTIDGVYYVISIYGMPYNDLYALYLDGTTEDNIVVPKTTTLGYIDSIHRRKYISIPVGIFWTSAMRPVILTK